MAMQMQLLPEAAECEDCGGIGWIKSGVRSQLCEECHGSGQGGPHA